MSTTPVSGTFRVDIRVRVYYMYVHNVPQKTNILHELYFSLPTNSQTAIELYYVYVHIHEVYRRYEHRGCEQAEHKTNHCGCNSKKKFMSTIHTRWRCLTSDITSYRSSPQHSVHHHLCHWSGLLSPGLSYSKDPLAFPNSPPGLSPCPATPIRLNSSSNSAPGS